MVVAPAPPGGDCMLSHYVPTSVYPLYLVHSPGFVFILKAWPLPGGILCGVVRRTVSPLPMRGRPVLKMLYELSGAPAM